jgi:5-methylcytosine-specific restriction endonuclease McrA
MFKDGIKERKCELCGISEWLGIQLPLELHHKDGNHLNNNLHNLQILCPNCHSIQEGNAGANVGKYTRE